jgi:hypothetical protein
MTVPAVARFVVATFHATCSFVVLGVVLYALLDEHRTFLGPAWSARRAPSTGGGDASLLKGHEADGHSSGDRHVLTREKPVDPRFGEAPDHRNPSTPLVEEAGAACEPDCCAETWPVDVADATASTLLRCANSTASPELPFTTGVVVVTMITKDVRARARTTRKEVSHPCIQDRAP